MPDNNEAKWYIIHTFGGYEKKVKTSIENYAKAQDMENIIQEVYLPNNDKVDKDLWYKIRNTNGVTGFVAPDPNKPTPMTEEDLVKMGLIIPSTVEVDYRIGDLIIITDGPFKDSKAIVKDINEEKQQVTVTVSMFGRETPVTLDFIKVRKV